MKRVETSPAVIGSLTLHVGVAVAIMVSWGSHDLHVGSVVPVTLVSNAPVSNPRPAVEAQQEQPALAEEPVPTVPPSTSQPELAPPAPNPQPAPEPAEKGLNLDALAATIAKAIRSTNAAASATKGPNRAEAAVATRQTTGSGPSGAALSGLASELQRRWNPNCDVEGGSDIQVQVVFILGVGGQVVGEIQSRVRGPTTSVAQAAAERAVRAVHAASPFRTLPRQFYGERINVNFNAREACATL